MNLNPHQNLPELSQVAYVPLSHILPDRFQARLAIPPEIRRGFFQREYDCYEAVQRLVVAASGDYALNRMVEELRLLGQSIMHDQQIEPATGIWIEDENRKQTFLLETGERRFWGLALLAVELQMQEEPQLKVTTQNEISRERQFAENFLREDLCAVEIGKAIAAMILESMNIYPDDNDDDLSYARKVLKIIKLPEGTWSPIIERFKRDRSYLRRHIQILSLDDQLLHLATLYRLPEGALRSIVLAEKEQQRGLMLKEIDKRMPRKQEDPSLEGNGEQADLNGQRQLPAAEIELHKKFAQKSFMLLKPLLHGRYNSINLKKVGRELANLIRDPGERSAAADALEAIATSLRKY